MALIISPISKAESKYWVKFGNEKAELKRIDSGFINIKCDKCQALSNINKEVQLDRNETALKNPFSVACTKIQGKVRIGKLYSGHSQSFCFFKDESFMSTNMFRVTKYLN